MHATITQKQAEKRVHHYVVGAMDAIGTGRLEKLRIATGPCSHPTDEGPDGRVQASESYFIHDVPTEHNEQVFQAFQSWATHNNFRILKDTNDVSRFLWVENNKDGFRMSLEESTDGNQILSIGAVSPCVWPNGTPEPEPTY